MLRQRTVPTDTDHDNDAGATPTMLHPTTSSSSIKLMARQGGAGAGGGGYSTFGTFGPATGFTTTSPRVEDVNGDGRVSALDEARNLADEARANALATARAARRHAALNWWFSVLLIFVNALATATGVGAAAVATDGGSGASSSWGRSFWTIFTAGLSATAAVIAGLKQALQPAERAAQCRAGAREFERLYREMDYLQRLTGLADDDAAAQVRKAMEAMEHAEQAEAVADAIVRYRYAVVAQ